MNHAAELSYTPDAASSGPAQPEPIPTHPHMTTAPQPITLTIPAAIVALPDLTLVERAILALLADDPAAGNGKLARQTWLTHRGVEALTRRLRKQGHLQPTKVGGGRHLLVTAVALTKCGEPQSATPCPPRVGLSSDAYTEFDDLFRTPGLIVAGARHIIPGPAVAASEVPLSRFLAVLTVTAEGCSRRGRWGSARKLYEGCISRLTTEDGVKPEDRDKQLARLQRAANRCYVLEHLIPEGSKLPVAEVQKLVSILNRAALAQVLEFRQRIESGADLLDLTQEILALAAPVEAVPAQPTPPASSPLVAPVSGPDAEPTDDLD